VALVAGDHTQLTSILRKTQRLLTAHPTESVTEIAALVADCYVKLQQFYIERLALAKFGLTYVKFLREARNLPPDVLREILAGIREAELEAEFLVVGLDSTGQGQLYKIQRGVPEPYDASGFAAIGWGERIAGAQFMASDYSRHESIAEALWLCYYAKRRAEAVPSVGARGTDLFTIRQDGGFKVIHPLTLNQTFAEAYDRVHEGEQRHHTEAVEKVEAWAREAFTPRQRGIARSAEASRGRSRSKRGSSDQPRLPESDESPEPVS
jgi:hypothetical protein